MRRRLTPSLLVALVALAIAAGVTLAAATGSETAADKKLAAKVIKKLAPKLSVKKAKTANTAATAKGADSATNAATTDTLSGKSASDLIAAGKIVHFSFKLSFGAQQTIATAGSLSLTASCLQNTTSNNGTLNQDVSRILIATTQDGAVFDGADAKRGGPAPTDFLNTTTLETDRVVTEDAIPTGTTNYDAENDSDGAAFAPDGSAISLSQDGVGLGENVLGANCVFQGTAVIEN
jgi:hypothetical protein